MSKRLLDPKQEAFLAYYTNPKSETFGNATQSGLKAGYTLEYSENITSVMPDWLSENMGDLKRLKKAEKVLDETMDFDVLGEEGKVLTDVARVRLEAAKIAAKGLGKGKYSERTEHTGKDGGAIEINSVSEMSDEELLALTKADQNERLRTQKD